MCGIAGCLALAPQESPDQNWVATATERISHRGPDDEGYFSDADVALGYKRLAIIDLSEGGHQPMRSADGRYWMVFNGEIYNYIELGEQLRREGVALRTSCDSEVLLETYARVGKDVVHRLRGMFAFAIWDTWTRELFCARDQFGIKPFYYTIDQGPARADPGPAGQGAVQDAQPGPGPQARSGGRHAAPAPAAGAASPPAGFLDDWFTPASRPGGSGGGRHAAGNGRQSPPEPGTGGGLPADSCPPGYGPGPAAAPAFSAGPPQPGAPGSAMADLRLRFSSERKSLAEPGAIRALDADALRQYLSFQYVPPPRTLTPPIRVLPPGHALIARPGQEVDVYRYWRAELRPARAPSAATPAAILAALRDSIRVHLRSDAPLGAFLSGGIDSAAICALAAEHRPDLQTFTVGFEREGYSEIDRAQETASALGVKSHPYVISPEEFFHHLPQIIWHLDDPMADAAAVPLWFVAREASRVVKVVLSGEGSDELFGGYQIYHQPTVVRAGERLPDWGRAPLAAAASVLPSGVRGKGLLERTSKPLRRRYIGNANVFTSDRVGLIARGGRADPWEVTGPVYDQAEESGLDDVSTMQLVDINTWLVGDILVKADRMTMAHSLELRVPFLDREVMAVACRLARDEKVGAGTTKLALREAMSQVLPKAAAERAKLGFPVPIGHWLKGEAYGFADRLLRQAQTQEWINRESALALLERFRSGDPDVTWRHLWVLIVFSLWHQIYVERVYDPVALGWERAQGVTW
jgi:asparagine synthase (glutamine-hydrolysing)